MSLSDIIFETQNITTCPVCLGEDNLRLLPCNHVECSGCIELEIRTSRENGTELLCPKCRVWHDETSSDMFPVATEALAANRAAYAKRERDGKSTGESDDEEGYESVEEAEEAFEYFAKQHIKKLKKMKDPNQRILAVQRSNTIWERIVGVFVKVKERIMRRMSECAELLKCFWIWIEDLLKMPIQAPMSALVG